MMVIGNKRERVESDRSIAVPRALNNGDTGLERDADIDLDQKSVFRVRISTRGEPRSGCNGDVRVRDESLPGLVLVIRSIRA
jgi:hypothetical protein